MALPKTIEEVRTSRPDAFILLDSPSLGPVLDSGRGAPRRVAETSTVLRNADQVLLVITATSSKLPDIANSVSRLRDEGVVVMGAVINRQRRRVWWPF
jgi:Mrp family chromosome partitioning ATPase